MLCTLARPTSGGVLERLRRRERTRRRPQADRARVPGPDARRLPHGHAEPPAARRGSTASTPRSSGVDARCSTWSTSGTVGIKKVQTYSGGMRRRLEIAARLMHSPRVLFLDEPTIGLDPQTRASIWRYIRAMQEAEGTTIFMTTHYMDEAEFGAPYRDHGPRGDRRAGHAGGAQGERRRRRRGARHRRTTTPRSPRCVTASTSRQRSPRAT